MLFGLLKDRVTSHEVAQACFGALVETGVVDEKAVLGMNGEVLLDKDEQMLLLAARYYKLLGKNNLKRAQMGFLCFVAFADRKPRSKNEEGELILQKMEKIAAVNKYFDDLGSKTNLAAEPFILPKKLDVFQKPLCWHWYVENQKIIDKVFSDVMRRFKVTDP